MNIWEAFQRMQQCRDLARFYHLWATATHSGLPLGEIFSQFEKKNPSIYITTRRDNILAALSRGDLNLSAQINGFTSLEIAFINIGIQTGNLDTCLQSLSAFFEADWRAARKVQRKLAYPLFIAFLACWIPTIPLIIYGSPWLWIGTALVLNALVFSFGGMGVLYYFERLRGKPKLVQARYLWTLSIALEAGLSLEQSLTLAQQAAEPSSLAKNLKYVVPNGRPLHILLASSGAFGSSILAMIKTGEVSGTLPATLQKIAIYLENGQL